MSLQRLSRSVLMATTIGLVAGPIGAGTALAQQAPGYDSQDYGDQGAPQPGYYDQQGDAPQDGATPPQGDYRQAPSPYPNAGAPNGAPPAGYPAPSGDYRQAPYPDGAAPNGAPAGGYPAPPPPPQGYDGSQPPPPPPGYVAGPDMAQQQAQDQQYAAYAQQWSQAYCVKAHGNVGQGAVIGGVVGALLGSGFGGHGAGALVGAGVGAAGGAAIADSAGSNATSPGCPPGFVVRSGAPAFAYGGYGGSPYLYSAPGWYQPWVFYGGVWTYRPYPYHVWYYRHYGWGPRYGGPRGYGPRGYRRHW